MRILKTKVFAKDAESHNLNDAALHQAVMEVRLGLVDAALGGNLIKKRLPISGRGKSSGLRMILAYKTSVKNVFCIYLFAKNETENLTSTHLRQLKKWGKTLLSLEERELVKVIKTGQLQEVIQDDDQANKKNSQETN
ncbi:MAG: type II toxin-antitoxin system RelE/ParE family toxin [Candidatus Melainabacteria bacterium]|nr:type II toxin-antitoxin system RelE/ParE family toxin [Candidatus Melainabacteria bacterium]